MKIKSEGIRAQAIKRKEPFDRSICKTMSGM